MDNNAPRTLTPTPFAESAGAGFIQEIPETTGTPGRASMEVGFSANNFVSGPPNGKDFNGIFRRITRWLRWWQAGGQNRFDAGFAAAVGGYPSGAVLQSAADFSKFIRSIADGNTVDPDGAGTNWEPAFGSGSVKDKAITNAKLADMATGFLKGRTTAGSGPVEDLALSALAAYFGPTIEESAGKRCVTYPGSYARQSGTISIGPDSAQTVTFLHPFTGTPTDMGCKPIISGWDNSTSDDTFIEASSTSASQIRLRNNNNGLSVTVAWFAEGYRAS